MNYQDLIKGIKKFYEEYARLQGFDPSDIPDEAMGRYINDVWEYLPSKVFENFQIYIEQMEANRNLREKKEILKTKIQKL